MRFDLTDDQLDFSMALDGLLSSADCAKVARSWADGDAEPGLALWRRLAGQGVTMLGVPDSGATPVDLCVAFERLGWWAVPGPWVESVAYLPVALGEDLSETIATVAVPPQVPRALDVHVAEQVYVVQDGRVHRAVPQEEVRSVDRTRHLFTLSAGEQVAGADPATAFDLAVLGTAAQLLGGGERMLADTLAYAKQRRQFGREIGSYQAKPSILCSSS